MCDRQSIKCTEATHRLPPRTGSRAGSGSLPGRVLHTSSSESVVKRFPSALRGRRDEAGPAGARYLAGCVVRDGVSERSQVLVGSVRLFVNEELMQTRDVFTACHVLVADALRAGGGADASALGRGRGGRDLGRQPCLLGLFGGSVCMRDRVGLIGARSTNDSVRALYSFTFSIAPLRTPAATAGAARREGKGGGGCMLLLLLSLGGRRVAAAEERGTSWPVLGSAVCLVWGWVYGT